MTRSWTSRVFIATSLDGFIARPDGDIHWLTHPPNQPHIPSSSPRTVDVFDQHMARVDCILMGRKSYEKGLSCKPWPYGTTKRIFVLSSTVDSLALPPTSPGGEQLSVQLVRSLDEAADVLEREGMRAVYVDGGVVVREFLGRGWIDEMVITVAPVVLGEGIPLWGEGMVSRDVRLELLGVDVIEAGMVSMWYRVRAGM
ncbi:hypothetical protein FE257_007719 [Aspergillus nanangensis]|uniref:2,5-diamino-6-ribosylamino-4(3H)-pyrimidinone 5'-phosphate reductase n=1 Tax=Aspergillus nanangensis TaxID=2582783 RepID=A0AAD4CXB3_ASPNN|nr:hypothetical protein FE257_007719 [Aspergillus nanangensis]